MDFKNFKMDKDQLEKGGKIALRIGKAIVIEGVKGLAIKTATAAISAPFEGKDVKIGLDDIIGKEKPKGPKKRWFSKDKDEVEEILEEISNDEVSAGNGIEWVDYKTQKQELEKNKKKEFGKNVVGNNNTVEEKTVVKEVVTK